MMGPSKILTVSYGTFSCTLEGFDDPFSTMRSIAEYFRDLAAEDRYFGAEPPTPDAEMLHKIAEREVQRRVEARVGENSVVLRQLDGSHPQDAQGDQEKKASSPVDNAPAKAAAAIAAAATQSAQSADEADMEPADAATDETAEIEEAGAASLESAESVAEKLARIRAATASEDSARDAQSDYVEDQHADPIFESAPISAAFEDVDDIQEPVKPDEQDELAGAHEAPVSETPENVDRGGEFDVTADPESSVEAQSATGPEPDFTGNQADDFETAENGAKELVAETDELDVAQEEVSADTAEDHETSVELEGEAVMDEVEPADMPELAVQETSVEDAVADGTQIEEPAVEQTEDSVSDFMARSETDHDATLEEDGDDWDDADVADPDAPAIARVVKMRREDFENAIQSGTLQEFEQEEPQDHSQDIAETDEAAISGIAEALAGTGSDEVEAEEGTLSPEDEAELMATLEAVQRKAEAEARAEKEGRALLENQDIEENAESVSRILDVTNTEMEETEGTRRRSAIAHLKAAVAATRADKLLSRLRKDDEEKEMNQYRQDLAKVVRPKRPAAEDGPKKKRRVAPLVLVSEQRVDEEQAVETPPAQGGAAVRPRRISRDNLALSDEDETQEAGPNENIFIEPESFAKFASEVGAHDLPDLLEAAAAYMSFVEGHEYFSRPQIMKAVAAIKDDEEYSREETLRSFGKLLRRGKIKKIKRGQFTIAETTRFKPQQLAVGE